MKSNLIILVESFEIGIPIEYNGRMYKFFETEFTFELKYAVVRKSKEKNIEWLYMGNVPFNFVFEIAKNLSEAKKINLVHLLTQIKQRINKGLNIKDFTFDYEDEFFRELEKY